VISPGRRIGTLDGASDSTDANFDVDCMLTLRLLTGATDDEEDVDDSEDGDRWFVGAGDGDGELNDATAEDGEDGTDDSGEESGVDSLSF
jgi:hypothetical protein